VNNQKHIQRNFLLIPFAGLVLFVMLYVIAAVLYPGGSQADLYARGFSWMNNYWCNLLNEKAMNGEVNTARPVAFSAMFILCGSLALFWYQFAGMIDFKLPARIAIRTSGILSMITCLFLFSKSHDTIINVSGLLASFAIAGTFAGIYKNKWSALFWFGIFNFLLIGLNNYIYYTQPLTYLPLLQKITFLSFLVWISLLILKSYKRVEMPVK